MSGGGWAEGPERITGLRAIIRKLPDRLFGTLMFENRPVRFADVFVTLPEAQYVAVVRMYEQREFRDRLRSFVWKRMMGELRFLKPVPMLCGGNETFGSDFRFVHPASSPQEVIAEFRRLVLEMRKRASEDERDPF